MKSIVISSFLILIHTCLWAQNRDELERRNGFKDIKLGTPIDSVKQAIFKKDIMEQKFPLKIYETNHADYKTIGEVVVKKLELKVYNNLIYEINVYLPKDPRVMQGLEKSFGEATYSVRAHAYYWNAESLSLTFKGNEKQIHLTYKSLPILKQMHEDKSNKVDQVAKDF